MEFVLKNVFYPLYNNEIGTSTKALEKKKPCYFILCIVAVRLILLGRDFRYSVECPNDF